MLAVKQLPLCPSSFLYMQEAAPGLYSIFKHVFLQKSHFKIEVLFITKLL